MCVLKWNQIIDVFVGSSDLAKGICINLYVYTKYTKKGVLLLMQEIRRWPVEVGSWSHNLQGFI